MDLFLLLIVVLGALAFASPIVRPIIAAARGRERRIQFFISDLLWLMLLLHLPLAFVRAACNWHDIRFVSAYGTILLLMVLFLWWRGVGMLSRLGIERPLRRGVFLVVVLPVTVLGSLVAGPTVVLAFPAALGALGLPPSVGATWLICALAIPVVCYGCRRLALWVLAGATETGSQPSSPQKSESE